MNTVVDTRLSDRVVLVTRPEQQQSEFVRLLQENAAAAFSFPTISIQPVTVTQQLSLILSNINEYDLLVFVSANAVAYTAKLLQQLNLTVNSIETEITVIGSATAQAATKAGFKISYQAETGFNSEALLALSEMQESAISGKQVLIVRGIGGLEDLANGLKQRGAKTAYAEVYQRDIPATDGEISRYQLSKHWAKFCINTVTVTSNEALKNLYEMLDSPGRDAMLKADLVVPSQRCFKLAQSLGFESVTVAGSATNKQMIEAIKTLPNGK